MHETYRIRREVSLIFRFISCKYSPMLFVIYIFYSIIQFNQKFHGKDIVRDTKNAGSEETN